MTFTALFRADSDSAMGNGHVMRCFGLAEELAARGCVCHFACASLTSGLALWLKGAGFPLHSLAQEPGSPRDASETVELARSLSAASVIVDGYQFGEAWRSVLARGAWAVLTFDDLAEVHCLHTELVVNAAPHASSLPYDRIASGAEHLLGPDYIILRQEILEARAAPQKPIAERGTMLLSFGGADPLGLTQPCIDGLAERLPPSCGIIAVVGASNPRARDIMNRAERHAGRVRIEINARNMGALMNESGLAVAGAGTTVGELAALGVPSLLVIIADNQVPAAMRVKAQGWCNVVDARSMDSLPLICNCAAALWAQKQVRTAMGERARMLVDGLGVKRIADRLTQRIGLR